MTVKTDNYQIGVSGTPSNNFVIKTDGAGGMTISRGNLGAELGDIIKISSAGLISYATQQVHTNVTASRAFGVTYTNTTTLPISVNVTGISTGAGAGGLQASVGGNIIATVRVAAYYSSLFFVVPPGATYSVALVGTDHSIDRWVELR